MFEAEIFRNNLKKKRQELNLTQKDIAKAIGVTPQTLSGYEKQDGKLPTLDTAAKLAEYLGVSLDWLIGRIRGVPVGEPDSLGDVARPLVTLYEYGWGTGSPVNFSQSCLVTEPHLTAFFENWATVRELNQKGALADSAYRDIVAALLGRLDDYRIEWDVDENGHQLWFIGEMDEYGQVHPI